MKYFLLTISITLGLISTSYSQNTETSIILGKDFTINSKVLNEERRIQVFIPEAYEANKEKQYPVLYVLDGQEYFLHGVAYQDMLRFRDKTPEFIIVGIKTDRRKRRILFFNKSDEFIEFLSKELIPFIDTKYSTAKEKERIFFGWEMAAGLGFQILAEEKGLFSSFILASPTNASEERVNGLIQFKKDNPDSNTFMLVSAAPEESWITKDSIFLAAINHPNWRYTEFDREDHYTTPFKTIHEGLSDYFYDYKPIRKRSLKEYDNYGGIKALKAYYKKRGERYNVSQDIHKETKHFLIYNALQEDNFKRFEEYVNYFDGYIEANSRDNWLTRYGKFYLKHKRIDKALELYEFGIAKYPKSAILYEGISEVYKVMGKQKESNAALKKATDLK